MLPAFSSFCYIFSPCPAGFSCLGSWWCSTWLQQSSMTARSGNKLVGPFQESTFHGLHGHGAWALLHLCCGCWSASSCSVSTISKHFLSDSITHLWCLLLCMLGWMMLTRMLRKDCFGGTRFALHVPSSSRARKRRCYYYYACMEHSNRSWASNTVEI